MAAKRLVLAGGGHAHLLVLERMARERPANLDVVLVTPLPWQYYSGMLPGWIEGLYRGEEIRVDLRHLAMAAQASVRWQPVARVRAADNVVETADGAALEYDLLSLDTGGETDSSWAAGLQAQVLTVKPLASFQSGWRSLLSDARTRHETRIAVVGGGAAGTELALAVQARFAREAVCGRVSLVCGEGGLLPDHGRAVREKLRRALGNSGVEVIEQSASTSEGALKLADGRTVEADGIVVATGTRAPSWLAESGLELDGKGFVSVDRFHRSVSHTNVFAAGDVSSRADVVLARSGVHAVHAGKVLADNLVAAAGGRPLRGYRPARRSLYLLATGGRSAVASWGGWAVAGRWVWRWKDAIDRRFVGRFRPARDE